jgi:hypothetical protein
MENILNLSFEAVKAINEEKSNELVTFSNVIDDIVAIFITGSLIFKENAKDVDYFVLVKGFKHNHKFFTKLIDGKTHDFFIADIDFYKEVLTHNKTTTLSFYNVGFYITKLVYGEFIFDYNIKTYEKQQKRLVKKYLEQALFNKFRPTFKNLWWQYLTLKFLNNQNYVITDEDKDKMTRWSQQQMTEEEKEYWKTVLDELNKDEVI